MIKNKTAVTTEENIVRSWHLLDAGNRPLGRLAVEIASLLMGKNKTYFTRRVDCGDNVVVINASQVKLTGRKAEQKVYQHYSGYPGGRKEVAFTKMVAEQPKKVIRQAVLGMLPKNKLQARMITRLHVFADDKHNFADKLSKQK
jgi:large subunit ribosomal protein L13